RGGTRVTRGERAPPRRRDLNGHERDPIADALGTHDGRRPQTFSWRRRCGRVATPQLRAAATRSRPGAPRPRRGSAPVRWAGRRHPHPGTRLWPRGRITGFTAWQDARLLPRGYEVAYMRADIAVLLGTRAADRYREAYERLLGEPVEDLAVWDLVCALNALH